MYRTTAVVRLCDGGTDKWPSGTSHVFSCESHLLIVFVLFPLPTKCVSLYDIPKELKVYHHEKYEWHLSQGNFMQKSGFITWGYAQIKMTSIHPIKIIRPIIKKYFCFPSVSSFDTSASIVHTLSVVKRFLKYRT